MITNSNSCKVCSMNFEPPDIDLCSCVPHLPTFSQIMEYFNSMYIKQTDLGVAFHNLLNNSKPLTLRFRMFQLLLSMKSQLDGNCYVHRDSFPKEKQF